MIRLVLKILQYLLQDFWSLSDVFRASVAKNQTQKIFNITMMYARFVIYDTKQRMCLQKH